MDRFGVPPALRRADADATEAPPRTLACVPGLARLCCWWKACASLCLFWSCCSGKSLGTCCAAPTDCPRCCISCCCAVATCRCAARIAFETALPPPPLDDVVGGTGAFPVMPAAFAFAAPTAWMFILRDLREAQTSKRGARRNFQSFSGSSASHSFPTQISTSYAAPSRTTVCTPCEHADSLRSVRADLVQNGSALSRIATQKRSRCMHGSCSQCRCNGRIASK